MVMIYSLDRETPAQKLFKYNKEELEAIAEKVKSLNINVKVY
jgi:ABC-type Fe3+-hydroxamate transport system substrate-binding protein